MAAGRFTGKQGQIMALLAPRVNPGEAIDDYRVRVLGDFPLSDNDAYIRADIVERLQNQFELLSDAPVYWQADVRSIVRNNGNALLKHAAPRLADWPEQFDAKQCVDATRAELLDIAQAWRDWPVLWNAAREQGDRLVSGL